MIELGDQAMSIIESSLQGAPLQYVIPQYKNYTYTSLLPLVTNGSTSSTEVNFPIPAKFNSVKSLFITMRDKADGVATFFPFSHCHYGLSQYRFRIGAEVLPAKPPTSSTEFFAELLKSIGSLSDLNHEPLINKLNYYVNPSASPATDGNEVAVSNAETATSLKVLATADPNLPTTNSYCFAMGFDCETYAGSDKDRIFSGMNTTTSDIYAILTHTRSGIGANNPAVTVRYDAYALYDAVAVCENGVLSVRF